MSDLEKELIMYVRNLRLLRFVYGWRMTNTLFLIFMNQIPKRLLVLFKHEVKTTWRQHIHKDGFMFTLILEMSCCCGQPNVIETTNNSTMVYSRIHQKCPNDYFTHVNRPCYKTMNMKFVRVVDDLWCTSCDTHDTVLYSASISFFYTNMFTWTVLLLE